MRTSRIKAKLSKNLPVLLTTLHYSDPSIFEMASLMGFDGIWLDLEHHHHSVATAEQLLRAARVGTSDVMVRPAKGEFMRMGRLLEAGAQGIMYPRCESAEEAAELVRWAKFAPQGEVATVRQARATFSDAMADFGDPKLAAPFDVQCEGDVAP